MKPSNEFCINFLKASGWLDNHDKQIRKDAIDEIIEYYKPCNDCGVCLEDDRNYFKKKCEFDIQISYTELVEDLKRLKEQKQCH